MSLKKIADVPSKFVWPCGDREHDPPQHVVLKPGVYQHTCLGCGRKQVFTVYPKLVRW